MRFREFMQMQFVTDDPDGDFVGDMQRDTTFPDVGTEEELLAYLRRRGACDEALGVARDWWMRFYVAGRMKNPGW